MLSFNIIENAEAAIAKESGLGLPVLMEMLFQNPTDLELNFQVMQAQMAEGNLEAAEATLERVMILDPDSRLARFLIAEIRIKLGKFASAQVLLNELINDETTAPETRQRAIELIASIDEATSNLNISGGYSVFMGQAENAFGRSEENSILFIDLPIKNTTKDKSDQFYGYHVYYRMVKEMNLQTPTYIDGGIKFSLRDTHDPALSDLRVMAGDISLIQSSKYRLTGGLFGSYTDINHQDFSRNLGLFMSMRIPVFEGIQVATNLAANRSIYMPHPDVMDNPDKSNRAYSAQIDFTRPTTFGYLKLGLSSGISLAQDRTNNYRYEKTQISSLVRIGPITASGSVSRQATRYHQPNIFISAQRRKSQTNAAALKLQFQAVADTDLGTLTPYLQMRYFETESNIPNYRRNGGEVTMGVGSVF